MDLSKLAPADAVVALRSLERRYRGLFAGIGGDAAGTPGSPDESPDEIARRPAGNGWSAIEHVVAAAWAIAACQRALQRVLNEDVPHLDPAEVDPAHRDRPGSPTGTLHERLAELGLEANAMADGMEHVPADDWERLGVVDDSSGRRVSALDVARSAVDAGVTHLRAAEYTLDEVRA